jgi:hypothetical protein
MHTELPVEQELCMARSECVCVCVCVRVCVCRYEDYLWSKNFAWPAARSAKRDDQRHLLCSNGFLQKERMSAASKACQHRKACQQLVCQHLQHLLALTASYIPIKTQKCVCEGERDRGGRG